MNTLGEFLFALLMFVLIGIMIGIVIGRTIEESKQHDIAVKSGHAEYYLDEKNERQWRWK